jgi:hypothetical protein
VSEHTTYGMTDAERIVHIDLPDGSWLARVGPHNLWALYRGEFVRMLNRFEVEFVDAALASKAEQSSSTSAGQLLINAGALRQYRHNDGSEGFVFGYDKAIVDREFARLQARQEADLRAQYVDNLRLLDEITKLKGVAPNAEAALDACKLADDLYSCGYTDRQKERDYDPRAAEEWQSVVDAITLVTKMKG